MDDLIIENWNSVVKDGDKVYHLGDVCFKLPEFHRIMPLLKGKKRLILGNHDQFKMKEYSQHFGAIYSWRRIPGEKAILCHYPLHPMSVRGCHCIHGHIHDNVVMLNDEPDTRYTNVCVEKTNYRLVALDEVLAGIARLEP